jgi:hypothetical protein
MCKYANKSYFLTKARLMLSVLLKQTILLPGNLKLYKNVWMKKKMVQLNMHYIMFAEFDLVIKVEKFKPNNSRFEKYFRNRTEYALLWSRNNMLYTKPEAFSPQKNCRASISTTGQEIVHLKRLLSHGACMRHPKKNCFFTWNFLIHQVVLS